MKNLSDELLASFKNRIKENEALVNDVQKTLDGFHKDHQEMAAVLNANAMALRKNLATGEKERLNTYKELMGNIHHVIASIQKEVVEIQTSTFNLINEFASERTQMAAELNKFFAEGRAGRMEDEKIRMEEFDSMMKEINEDIKSINAEVLAIFKNTNDMLENFEKGHQEMSAELRADLSKNLAERVEYTRTLLNGFQKRLSEISKENQKMAQKLRKDLANGETSRLTGYKGMMKGIHSSIKGIHNEVKDIQKASAGLIDYYAQDRNQGLAEWTKMQDAIAQLRKTGVVKQPKEVVVKAEKKKEAVTEIEIKPVAEVPVEVVIEVQPKEEPDPIIPMKLDEKVMDYISKHPNGVKISEMEGPLGETRMKLGYIAKALLDERKVQKVDNVYFPLK
ncbi:MAG: hypothetical protein AAB347_08790 [Bacteroidota bacterium]